MTDQEPSIISFHGADGSGKSKIAHVYKDIYLERSQPAVVIGGSSYDEWLTPQVVKETLGGVHSLDTTPVSPREKQRRFEEIAVACYGYAGHLSEQSTHVVIDSDPLLKKLIWEKLNLPPDEFVSQAARFGSEVIDRVAATSFPDYIVGVNIQSEISPEDLYARIQKRTTNTEHDPKSVEQASRLIGVVSDLWVELENSQLGGSSIELFNQRFGRTAYLHTHSPECPRREIRYHAERNARWLAQEVDSSTLKITV